jgi:hypothetical protein
MPLLKGGNNESNPSLKTISFATNNKQLVSGGETEVLFPTVFCVSWFIEWHFINFTGYTESNIRNIVSDEVRSKVKRNAVVILIYHYDT